MFRRIRAATRLVYLLDGGALELDPELAELAELRCGDRSAARSRRSRSSARPRAMRSNEVVLARPGPARARQEAAAPARRRALEPAPARDRRRSGSRSYTLAAQQTIVRALVRELMLLDALPAFVDVDDAVVVDARSRRDARVLRHVPRRVGRARSRSRSIASACRASTSARSCTSRSRCRRCTCARRCGSRWCRR